MTVEKAGLRRDAAARPKLAARGVRVAKGGVRILDGLDLAVEGGRSSP